VETSEREGDIMTQCGAHTFDLGGSELFCIREVGHVDEGEVQHMDRDGWLWSDPYKPTILSDDENPF
jgi:hypothetical protein